MKKIICAIISIAIIFTGFSVSADVNSAPYWLTSMTSDLMTKFYGGELGDEAYVLISKTEENPVAEIYTLAITGSSAVFTHYDEYLIRTATKAVAGEALDFFTDYMRQNAVDQLPDYISTRADEPVEHGFLHITKEGRAAFIQMSDPDKNDEAAYYGLIQQMKKFLNGGGFTASYSYGPELLIPRENYTVKSFWNDGDDMRVCIATDNVSEWRSFAGGAIGGPADEPEGFTLVGAFDDIMQYTYEARALGFITGAETIDSKYYASTLMNRYPWLCTWEGRRLRQMDGHYDAPDQLWLTAAGQEPLVFKEGNYSFPMVIPGTDTAVAEKDTSDGNIAVKFDLRTGEESVLPIPPANYNTPFFMLGDRLLSGQGQGGPRYLWDPVTNEATPVPDGFPRIYVGDYYRNLQSAGAENLYYFTDIDTPGVTTLGIIDAENVTFTPLREYRNVYIPPMDIWVDSENRCVYAICNGDLVRIPDSLAIPASSPTELTVNGKKYTFNGYSEGGRLHASAFDLYEDSLGINIVRLSDMGPLIISHGRKILVLKNGSDSMVMLDLSEMELDKAVDELLAAESYDKLEFIRTVPLDTSVINGYFPLRAVCESFGGLVSWDPAAGVTVAIDEPESELPDGYLYLIAYLLP